MRDLSDVVLSARTGGETVHLVASRVVAGPRAHRAGRFFGSLFSSSARDPAAAAEVPVRPGDDKIGEGEKKRHQERKALFRARRTLPRLLRYLGRRSGLLLHHK
ncbi:hypothetical protein GUJ93_ZPchr0001g32809 [Zizania palustris]|uniref:Uncharacterized protein n=1 Tax=Zizania palustris TaxID=103762 RepID=A0A8J5RTE2_ZIZPA|nr:hypothetical protein GUJ93_ZPchr0001g32809 [Zizania palustris]